MKRSSLLVAVVTLASLAYSGIGHAAQVRSETKPYVAVGGDGFDSGPVPGGVTNDCSATTEGQGGQCFNLQTGDAFIKVTVKDDNTTAACAVLSFTDDGSTNSGSPVGPVPIPVPIFAATSSPNTPFAGSIGPVKVPDGAQRVWVFTAQADGLLANAPATPAGPQIARDDIVTGTKCKTNKASGAATTGTITLDVADAAGF